MSLLLSELIYNVQGLEHVQVKFTFKVSRNDFLLCNQLEHIMCYLIHLMTLSPNPQSDFQHK